MSDFFTVKKLTKLYRVPGFKVRAVEDISFSVSKGDFLSFLGPSGAGKSTLLHSLGGILPPDSGEVLYKNQNIYKQKEKHLAAWRNKNIGFVFQFYHLIEELNILENVVLAAENRKRKDSLQKAWQLLEYFGLADRASFYPSQLSGGQKQRAAIARALINEPEIILCDEPTGNLDQKAQDKIETLLKEINNQKKTTIILVTHNLKLARTAKRIMFIEAGRLIEKEEAATLE